MVWELPGTQVNVCGDVYVVPSTTIEPDGSAVTMIDTVTGGNVVLAEFVVEEKVELVLELAVVVVMLVSVVDMVVELEVVLFVVVVVVFVVCNPIVNAYSFRLFDSSSSAIWLSGSTTHFVVWLPACAVSGPTYQVCTSPGAMLSGPPRP